MGSPPSNAEIARVLQELIDLLVMAEGSKQAFRVRAYEKAVGAVQALPEPVADMTQADLVRVSGIGKSTAAKILGIGERTLYRKIKEYGLRE